MFGRTTRISPLQKSKPKPGQKPSRTLRVKASLLSLESRLMFDAAAAATEVEVNQEQVAQEQAEAAVSSDHTAVPESHAADESQELLQAIASYSPGETPTEIAFVDPTVPDYQSLIAGMGANIQIVMLDGGQDGMEQIAASLVGRTGIDAIHIISHGAEGQLSLGTGTLSQASMTGEYADELATIKQALSEQADILVYGCDFAEGHAGQEAATLLSQLTGADVAASTDDTGYVGLGGDWDFEFRVGVIETEVAISYDTQADWVGLLSLTTSGSETRVNTTTTGTQTTNSNPDVVTADSVAMDASGNYVTVWESAGDIYGQRYNSVGTAQGSEFIIANNAANERLASVSMNASGAFVVAWERDQGTGDYDIYARLYNSSGTAVGSEFLVNETTTYDQEHGRVAMAAGGSFVVMFESNAEASGTYYDNVYAQRYDSTGTKIGSNFMVNTTTSGDQDSAEIAMDSAGNFVVVWESERTAGTSVYSIYGQRYDSAGVAQGTEFLVNSVASTNDQHAAVAMNDSGNFVVTWDRQSGGDADIQAQRFSSSGVTQGSAISVTSNATYFQKISNVAMDGGGNFVVSWSSNNQDGSGWGVYTRQYDNTGTALTTESRVATTTSGTQDYSGVAYQNGKVVVTWSGNGTGDTAGIFMQRYTAAGGNAAPTITSNGGGLTASVSVAENTTSITTVTATDASPGQTLAYSISGGADASKFTINSSTGALSFITAPNYESPTDSGGNNVYDVIVTVTDGVGGADSQSIAVTVTNTNDAPVLADTALTLTVAEDAGAPSGAVGSPISAFTGGITEPDGSATKGLAITGSNSMNGTWYYTTNGGTTWTVVGTVSNTSALLLADNASTRLFFSPNANYNGTSAAALTLRAWDQTSGTAGTKVTTAMNGGTTAFSSATDTVDVTVTAVNDAPTIASLSGDSRAYSEGAGAVVIESGNALVADVDSTNLDTGTLTISIPTGGDSAEDVLSIRNQGISAGQIGVSSNTITYGGTTIGTFVGGSSGSALVITFNSSATPTAVTALVRNITYQNTDTNAPTTGARTVRFVLTDGDGGTSPNYDTTVTVTAVNDAPVLADTVLSLTVAEDAGVPSGAVGRLVSAFTGGITDVDASAVKGIAITGSNQTNGTWYYTRNGGTTWTAVGTVSNTSALLLADNASTRLYFAPRANYNGTNSAALTVRAWDQTSGTAGTKVTTAMNGGTTAFSSATDTVDVTVTAVNDAPTIASLSGDSRAYSEGAGAVVIESGNAVVADVDSTNLDTGTLTVSIPAGGDADEDVLSIRNQGTGAGQIGVSGGTVTYGGTTIGTFTGGSGGTNLVITFNGSATPTVVTALVRNITYQNTDINAPTTGARTVRFVLMDGDGGTSPSYNTTVTVSAVNDAPVLADMALSLTVAEDAGVPSGAVGSLISTFTGGITDVDSGASKGIAITGSNQTNGTWYYTTDGGSTWTVVGTVSNTSALLLADNASTRLYFAPNANYNGTSAAALTVRAWDQSSGTAGTKVSTASNGGTTTFSSATDTVDVTVTAVNDVPTDLALSANTVAENAANGTTVGMVSGTDPDSGDTKTYSFTDSAGGRFAINSSTGQITVADGSLLNYESATNHSVTVRVTDSGGLTYDETFTINLMDVNEAPTGADSTITINEDTAHTFTTGNFGFSDVDAGDSLSAVRIDTLPGAGTLTLSGVAVTAGQVVAVSDITAGNLVFTPAADANGTGYASFTFSVRDSGNLYDSGPNTLTVNVTAVNDAPVNTVPGAQTVNEDTPLTIMGLSVNDVDGNLSMTQLSVTNGTLWVSLAGGATISAGANDSDTLTLSGTQAQINAALVTLTYNGMLNFTGSDTLTMVSTDSAGVPLSDTDTVAITVTAVNDAPVITPIAPDVTFVEDGAAQVIDATGTITDVDSTNFDMGVMTVSVTQNGSVDDRVVVGNFGTGPGQVGTFGSTLTYGGVVVGTFTGGSSGSDPLVITFNSSATPAAVQEVYRSIQFDNVSHNPSTVTRQITFELTDGDGGTATPQTKLVYVQVVNDAPVLADQVLTLSVAEDAGAPSGAVGSLVSALTGGITDVDSGAVTGIAITGTDETNGTWYYTTNGGTTWTAVGNVNNTSALLLADNANTRLYFAPNADYNGTSTGALTLRAWDQMSGSVGTKVDTSSSGGTTASSTATDTVDVIVSAVNDAPVNAVPGAQSVTEDTALSITGVSVTDVDGNLSTVQLGVLNGSVSVTLQGDAAISAASNGTTILTLSGSQADINATLATLTYQGTLNYNGSDTLTVTSTDSNSVTDVDTVAITVTAVDDATVVTGGTSGTGNEDMTITGTLTATDAEGLADGTVFTVSTNATNGTASIDPATGLWSYAPNADFNGSDSFTVMITDDAGNTTTQVISVTVTPVNDAPLLVTNTGSTVAEGGTDTIDASELAVTDVEQTSVQLTYMIGTGPLYGRLELTTAPGVSATSFTQADIAANRLIYIHDGSEPASDSFTFTANDGAGGSLGLTTVTLTITPVNDTPTITSGGGGSSISINVAENVTDVTIVMGEDVDLPAQALSYSISGGVDQALFTINAVTGALSFTAPPDFEVVTDANGDNVYVVQVQVIDSQGASTTQTVQVTVTDVTEGVPLPPTVPPVLLSPLPQTGGPIPEPGAPPPADPVTPVDRGPVATPVQPAPTGPPVNVEPLSLIPAPDRPMGKPLDELKRPIDAAREETPLFLVNDDQGRPLFTVLPVEPAPTLEPEPPETTPSVRDLLMAKLDEMTVSLEQAVSQSQERHELMARVAAVTGTTLSVGFVAWALRSGAILASCLATMPVWRHFDPLPVVKLGRNERRHRRDETTRAQQQEAAEFKGLNQVLDKTPALKRTA